MSNRIAIHIELTVPNGQTARDVLDWLTRCFSYYFASYNLKILSSPKDFNLPEATPVETPSAPPADDLL